MFGQADFTTRGGRTPECWDTCALTDPYGAVFDGAGHLYIVDTGHFRVLEYDSCANDFGGPDNDTPGGSFGGTVPPAPHWIYDEAGSEGSTSATDACDSNDDNNGCADSVELGPNHVTGGQRDPLNPWDFADMWAPALPDLSGSRNGAISIADVIAVLPWIGASDNGPSNSSGNDYDSDTNANGVKDGVEYDRTPSSVVGQPWRSGPPNGAVTIADALVVVNSIGDHC